MESVVQVLIKKFRQFVQDDKGVTAIEYGLIAALIAVVIIASVQLVGTNLSSVFSGIAASL
ncbi:Flp family type IVb pilin [Paraburkholderia hospita]|uniref:Flp family type IVb pilin n=1 Tax=Paraburkholderia hospita TaxID=169430 RepID=UPI003ECCD08C